MTELPPDAEKLLAVAPDRFVAERKALAKKLREDGRGEDAAAVEALRKPTAVVLAVNRAARDRPKAAKAAADAAERVGKAQLGGGDPEAFRKAAADLDDALDLLANVAVAHVAPSGKSATEAMRRRVRDLLRSAVADEEAREALARGALTEELDAPGFSPFAGMPVPAAPRKRAAAAGPTPAERRAEEKRARVEALRAELAEAEEALDAATKAARDAERDRARAESRVASLQKKLERESARGRGGRRPSSTPVSPGSLGTLSGLTCASGASASRS